MEYSRLRKLRVSGIFHSRVKEPGSSRGSWNSMLYGQFNLRVSKYVRMESQLVQGGAQSS